MSLPKSACSNFVTSTSEPIRCCRYFFIQLFVCNMHAAKSGLLNAMQIEIGASRSARMPSQSLRNVYPESLKAIIRL